MNRSGVHWRISSRTFARTAETPLTATASPAASQESDRAQEALSSLDGETDIDAVRYRALLNQAERIRLSLLMLARLRLRMDRESHAHAAVEIVDQALSQAAGALRAIRDSLMTGVATEIGKQIRRSTFRSFPNASQRNPRRHLRHFSRPYSKDAVSQMDALAGQLRAALELAAHSTPAGQEAFDKSEAARPLRLRFSGWLETLRANLTLDSSAFRHAIRLAVMVAIGEALGRGFYWQRSYWLPMTIVLVLKPEFTTTFSRGLLRIAGTVAGLLLATALFHLLPLTVPVANPTDLWIHLFVALGRPGELRHPCHHCERLGRSANRRGGDFAQKRDLGARMEHRGGRRAGAVCVLDLADLGTDADVRAPGADAGRVSRIFSFAGRCVSAADGFRAA